MTRLRGLSLKIKSLMGSPIEKGKKTSLSKSTGDIIESNVNELIVENRLDSKDQTHNNTRVSINFDLLDPVLILKKRQQKQLNSNDSEVMDEEIVMLKELIEQHIYSHRVLIYILQFVPLDLQRFYLTPSGDKTVTSIMSKHLFGYFKSDPTRTIHLIFKSLKIPLVCEQLHIINPMKNALYTELSNYHYLKKVDLNNVEYLYLRTSMDNSVPMRASRQTTHKWIKKNLKNSHNLTSLRCDRFNILSQKTIIMMLERFPNIKSIDVHVQFMEDPITPPVISVTGTSSDTFIMDSPRFIRIETPRAPFKVQMEDFGTKLKKSKAQYIHLTCDIVTDAIMQALLKNVNLRSLKLSCASSRNVDEDKLTANGLAELSNLKNLSTLHLNKVSQLGNAELELISKVISLRSLSLVDCGLTDDHLDLVLTCLSNLEALDISKNSSLTANALKSLSNTRITSITILDVPMIKDTFYYLSCSHLQNLCLSGEFVGDSELATLFDCNLSKSLKKLIIQGTNNISNSGLRIINCDAPTLKILSLTLSEKISYRGIQFLAEHPSITELHLSKSYAAAAISRAESLFANKLLHILDLSNIPVVSQDIANLNTQISPNNTLEELIIPTCELDGANAELLFKHFRALRNLEVLLPLNTTIEEWSMRNGVVIGQYCHNFKELYIHGAIASKQTSWRRVLFHTIPTLQKVKLLGELTSPH
jgi:hypothetical protein